MFLECQHPLNQLPCELKLLPLCQEFKQSNPSSLANAQGVSYVQDHDAHLDAWEHTIKPLLKRIFGYGIWFGLLQSHEDLQFWLLSHVLHHWFGLFLYGVSIFASWLNLIWIARKTSSIFIIPKLMTLRQYKNHE